MSDPNENIPGRWKVGVFTVLGFLMIGAITVYVNDRPYWWRPCQLVTITVEDATGLKMKSPVRSLGLEIGFLKFVTLSETSVRLGICITAPVQVLSETRAYIRSEGFLGDKFVELKPVKYVGDSPGSKREARRFLELFPAAHAAETPVAHAVAPAGVPSAPPAASAAPPVVPIEGSREIPVDGKQGDVSQVVNRVDTLVNELTTLTQSIKESVDPAAIKDTMKQLNRALEHASRALAPEGSLNTTAQRALAKLEDAIEQVRDLVTRVNKGEGSLGMLLNDPIYAEEIRLAVKNVNALLNRVAGVRFVVDVGASKIAGYDGGRGYGSLAIWPRRDRYYLLGACIDPRGKRKVTKTTTSVNGGASTVTETEEITESGILLTAMLGKTFSSRLELALGILHDEGTFSVAGHLGPSGRESLLIARSDLYFRSSLGVDDRLYLQGSPWEPIYVRAGLESFRKANGKLPLFFGAGISFDDEDIKLLFAFL